MSSTEQNKALARRAIAVWTTGHVDELDAIYAADYVNHQHDHPHSMAVRGVAAMKEFVAEFRKGFPDFRDTIEDQVAEGDRVVTRFTSRGTQRGPLMGIEPTGRAASWTAIIIDRIAGGRIAESWASWDMTGMLQQLGAAPEAPSPGGRPHGEQQPSAAAAPEAP